VPFWGGELGPHLTQCGRSRSVPACQVSSWSIQPFGYNPTIHQRDRQDRQTGQWSDSIGRTVLQTVAQKWRGPLETRETEIILMPWLWLGLRVGLDQRSYSTPGPVSSGMGDSLRTGKPPRFSHSGQLSHPQRNGKWVPAKVRWRSGWGVKAGLFHLWINVWVVDKTVWYSWRLVSRVKALYKSTFTLLY